MKITKKELREMIKEAKKPKLSTITAGKLMSMLSKVPTNTPVIIGSGEGLDMGSDIIKVKKINATKEKDVQGWESEQAAKNWRKGIEGYDFSEDDPDEFYPVVLIIPRKTDY